MEPSVPSASQPTADAPKEENIANASSDDDSNTKQSPFLSQVDLPALSETSPHAWNKVNEKQLRSALIGACKRMPRNAEAHFHLGLMHMRNGDSEEALRSFQHCRVLYSERMEQLTNNNTEIPAPLLTKMARVRAHAAQAAHLTAMFVQREDRAQMLQKLQRELVSATSQDISQPSVWNGLALLHLNEGGNEGARDVLQSIRRTFPDYLDALNNLGLAELALGNEEVAISCFQKVILCDREHIESLSNYGVILLRHGMYDAAIRAFDAAVEISGSDARGVSFACGGLAIARVALGQLAAAEAAARKAEMLADAANKPRFSMLLTSIYARRVSDAARRGLPFDDSLDALGSPDRAGSPASVPGDGSDGDADTAMRSRDARGEGNADGAKDKREVKREANTLERGEAADANAAAARRDPRRAIDGAVLRLRALARDVKTSSASTALGAVLRMRHECSLEESGNRNFGAEAAERLVEALEKDNDDATAWVQLALLQLSTGEYASAREFSVQAVSRSSNVEAGWNALGVASQLNVDSENAKKAYETAIEVIRSNYMTDGSKRGLSFSQNEQEEPAEAKEDVAVEEKGGEEEDGDKGLVLPLMNTSNRNADGERGETEAGCDDTDEDEGLNIAGRNALAAVYNNIGNLKRQERRSFSEALAAYEKSLKIGGENAIVYNNLALLYISSGRYDDASNMLDHALKLDGNLNCAVSNRLKLTALMRRRERPEVGDGDGAGFIDELQADFGDDDDDDDGDEDDRFREDHQRMDDDDDESEDDDDDNEGENESNESNESNEDDDGDDEDGDKIMLSNNDESDDEEWL